MQLTLLSGERPDDHQLNDGYACLADFSLLTMASDQSTVIPSCIEGGTIQWMSPELIYPESFGLEKIRPTKESDCYALGMGIHEVLGGQIPFTQWGAPLVIQKVLNGERPGRPRGEGGALIVHRWYMGNVEALLEA